MENILFVLSASPVHFPDLKKMLTTVRAEGILPLKIGSLTLNGNTGYYNLSQGRRKKQYAATCNPHPVTMTPCKGTVRLDKTGPISVAVFHTAFHRLTSGSVVRAGQ